jgi:outer membrane protein
MKLSKTAFGVLLALGISPLAHATDLLEIYHAAQGQDAVFAAARASRDAGQEKLTQGRALMLPSVNLNANTTWNDVTVNSGTAVNVNKQYNSHGYGATLVQPLFREQNWALYSESELQVVQTEAQFKLVEQDLVLRVAQAYFDVLIAQDGVHLTAAQKTAIAEQLEQAKRNFEVGTATITDTHEAQARYDLIVAQEIAAQSALEVNRRSLQQLINAAPGELNPLGAAFQLEAPQPANQDKWVEEAQLHNHQVAIAQAAAERPTRKWTAIAAGTCRPWIWWRTTARTPPGTTASPVRPRIPPAEPSACNSTCRCSRVARPSPDGAKPRPIANAPGMNWTTPAATSSCRHARRIWAW